MKVKVGEFKLKKKEIYLEQSGMWNNFFKEAGTNGIGTYLKMELFLSSNFIKLEHSGKWDISVNKLSN